MASSTMAVAEGTITSLDKERNMEKTTQRNYPSQQPNAWTGRNKVREFNVQSIRERNFQVRLPNIFSAKDVIISINGIIHKEEIETVSQQRTGGHWTTVTKTPEAANKLVLNNMLKIGPEEELYSDHLADYLDLTFIIDSGGKLSTRLYDKRDDFDFHIVNFPFLSSNIPSGPSYGVYILQLIRYARCCSHYDDFRYRHKCLVDRLLSQGYKALRLEKSFKKFYGRYQDLIEKYRRSVNAMVSDSFPGQFLFNM